MRWSTVRLIWAKELRDLFRDRRTVVLIFLLPVVLYPLLGFAGIALGILTAEQTTTIGVVGGEHLPPPRPTSAVVGPALPLAWLTLTPAGGLEQVAAVPLAVEAARQSADYPPLLIDGRIPLAWCEHRLEARALAIRPLSRHDPALLASGTVDVILTVPPGFRTEVEAGGRPVLELTLRETDEKSKLAEQRLRGVLQRWKREVRAVRFQRQGLPARFDDPFVIREPARDDQPTVERAFSELSEMLARFFPFLLIMWSMAGALHPAIDLTAGEKERGTLETLLLSAAHRSEIVTGKFLAIWLFASATALWNLTWIGGGTAAASYLLPYSLLRPGALLWCAFVTLQIAALFAAVSLMLGSFARSTKEGQYYLLPLFMVTMPLVFLPLVPGVELNLLTSLVPISGAVLLLQKLMLGGADGWTYLYFIPVLGTLALCSLLALWCTVLLFNREQVLFREAHRLSLFGRLLGRRADPPRA